jgi:hypothetical protein
VRKLLALAFIAFVTFGSDRTGADHMPLVYSDGAVVHGDWGLYRAGAMVPFVEGPYVVATPRNGTGYYFPSNRHDPAAYRSPPHRRPVPTEPWYRSWGAQSDPAPATIDAPYQGPAVIYAPEFGGHKHGKH